MGIGADDQGSGGGVNGGVVALISALCLGLGAVGGAYGHRRMSRGGSATRGGRARILSSSLNTAPLALNDSASFQRPL